MKNENQNKKEEQTLGNRCPACKASISYKPNLNKWKCDYCGSEFTVEEINSANKKNNSNEKKEEDKEKVEIEEQENDEYVNYKCESCGAEIIADNQTSATFCVYCGNTAILQSKLSGKFSPDKIIPFKCEKEQAIEAFKGLSKKRPLMPKKFNNINNIEKIRGIYIPFWLYDFTVSGDIKMNAETTESWTVGDTHYTKTNIYSVIRGGTMDFSNVPVDASTRFDNDIMNTIEPFNYKDLVPYQHAYLSGFYAEKYDEEADKTKPEAQNRALETTRERLKNSAAYSSKKIVSDTLKAEEKNRYYVLLPVWMVNVKYNNKMHIFAMNGQTGEFIGNIPLDKLKTVIYAILIFAISMIVCIMISKGIFILGE